MSRLKFRVWDNDFEQYINHGENRMELHPDGSLIVEYWEDYSATQYIDITKEPERYVIEQCTGLKDRSGRLIYEGDVVRVYDISGEVFKEGIVCWRDTAFGIVDQNTQAGFACPCMPVDIEADYFLCEVIGNIHEVK